jgi:taurine--2-oxoglutarate transaminase
VKFFWTWARQKSAAHPEISGSEGCWIRATDGAQILDAMSSNFQAAFGHSCAPVKTAIHRQIDEMPLASPKHNFALKRTVSEKLCALVQSGPGRIFFTVSGAESVENALKMARQVTGRPLVVARSKSYHGATMGAMSVTGDWRGQGHFGVQASTIRIPEPADDPDLVATRQIIADAGPQNIAAMCLETISGMNGVIIPPMSWWQGISALCREHGILLIVDEVSCGFWRTGAPLALHHYGLKPDFVCMAKAISAGYVPFGALWASETVASYYDQQVLSAGLTAYAHPVGLAATNAVLDLLKDGSFQSQLRNVSARFGQLINQLRAHHRVKTTRWIGMMAAIDLEPGPAISQESAWRHGLHIAIKDETIILAPPLVTDEATMDEMFKRLRALLE